MQGVRKKDRRDEDRRRVRGARILLRSGSYRNQCACGAFRASRSREETGAEEGREKGCEKEGSEKGGEEESGEEEGNQEKSRQEEGREKNGEKEGVKEKKVSFSPRCPRASDVIRKPFSFSFSN